MTASAEPSMTGPLTRPVAAVEQPAVRPRLPRLPQQLVPRPRLLSSLSNPEPLTIVRGPIGAGKTTLVAHWLEKTPPDGFDVRWVAVDRSLPAVELWKGLGRAIGAHAQRGSTDEGRAFHKVATLVDELTLPTLVVLDGFEDIGKLNVTDVIALNRDLIQLVQRSRYFHLVVTTRQRHLSDIAAAAGIDTTELGPEDLRFTLEEFRQLFILFAPDTPEARIARLHPDLSAHPTLVRVAATVMDGAPTNTGDDHELHAAIEHYLRFQLFLQAMDAELLTFASRISLADPITLEAATVASGVKEPNSLLDRLEAAGIGTREMVAGGWVLDIPATLRGALRRELDLHDNSELRRIHLALAQYYDQENDPLRAVVHATGAETWTRVSELVDEHFPALLFHHDGSLADVLAAVPKEVREASPSFRDLYSIVRQIPLRPGRISGLLPTERDELISVAQEPDLPQRLRRAFAYAMRLRAGGDVTRAADLAARIRTVINELDPDHHRTLLKHLQIVFAQLGITRFLGADLAGAETDLLTGYRESTARQDQLFAYDTATYAALTQTLLGDVESAEGWLERAKQHRYSQPAAWLSATVGTSGRLAAALIAMDQLDRDATDRAIAELGDLDRPDELWSLMLHVSVRYALLWGDPEEQLEQLERLARIRTSHAALAPPGSLADNLLIADLSDLLMATGQGTRAHQMLADLPIEHAAMTVRRARLALLRGDAKGAILLASKIAWNDTTSARSRLGALPLLALAMEEVGEVDDARELAQRALTATRQTGIIGALATIPRGGRTRLAQLADDDSPLTNPRLMTTREVYPSRLEVVELTDREWVVLEHLASEDTLEGIAKSLWVSVNTIRTQVRALYRKLDVSSREDAVVAAAQLGLLPRKSRAEA